MTKKPKLNLSDRLEIKILLDKKYSFRDIARSMGRSPNTIAYEVKVNGGVLSYNPVNANIYARKRKRDTRRMWSKIEHTPDLRTYIVAKLELHWNPDEISGRMREDHLPWYASKTAIYAWLRSVYGQQYCHLLYSGSYYVKPHTKKTDRVMIPDRVSIEERPMEVMLRTVSGHWEQDTVLSREGCRGGVSVGIERKSRFMTATKVFSMSTFEHMNVIKNQQALFNILSITFDNGIENKAHRTLGISTFFCDAYSSWQKGGVENCNKMLRRYFPKGTNFREASQQQIDRAVFRINNKPRKILGYKTATEVAAMHGIFKHINLPTVLIEG